MNIILLLLSALIFISYIQRVAHFYGIQKSISESYYRLPDKYKFIFTLSLWGFAMPVLIIGNSLLMFAAASAICFVGAAAAFKDLKITKQVHMVGAYGGILLGMVSIIIDYNLWELVLIASMLSLFTRFFIKNYIWWIEVIAFFTILLAIYINQL